MKKFFIFFVVVMSMMLSFDAFAASTWYAPVNIVSIDQTTSEIVVVCSHTDPAKFQNISMIIQNDKQNEQLAILLTAMVANKQVGITISSTKPFQILSVKMLN